MKHAGSVYDRGIRPQHGRRSARTSHWYADPSKVGSPALDLHIHDIDFCARSSAIPRNGVQRPIPGRDARPPARDLLIPLRRERPAEQAATCRRITRSRCFNRAVFEEGAVEFDSRQSPTLRSTVRRSVETPEFPVPDLGAVKSGVNVGSISATTMNWRTSWSVCRTAAAPISSPRGQRGVARHGPPGDRQCAPVVVYGNCRPSSLRIQKSRAHGSADSSHLLRHMAPEKS